MLLRAESVVVPSELCAGDLTVNLPGGFCEGGRFPDAHGVQILALVQNADCVVTHRMLMEKLWEERDPRLLVCM